MGSWELFAQVGLQILPISVYQVARITSMSQQSMAYFKKIFVILSTIFTNIFPILLYVILYLLKILRKNCKFIEKMEK
jgi:anaerobic C4-dicarboxylate transporter